jgi:hypothetical protein
MPNVIAADVIHSAAACSAKQNASMPAEPITFRGSWVGSNGRFAVGQVIERQRDERHAKGAYCDGRARLPAESAGCTSAAADGCGGAAFCAVIHTKAAAPESRLDSERRCVPTRALGRGGGRDGPRSGRIEARTGLRMMPTVGIEIERAPL